MYIVICKDTDTDGVARYHLATRRVFTDRSEAEKYAAECSLSRDPIVVEGRFGELRLPEPEFSFEGSDGQPPWCFRK